MFIYLPVLTDERKIKTYPEKKFKIPRINKRERKCFWFLECSIWCSIRLMPRLCVKWMKNVATGPEFRTLCALVRHKCSMFYFELKSERFLILDWCDFDKKSMILPKIENQKMSEFTLFMTKMTGMRKSIREEASIWIQDKEFVRPTFVNIIGFCPNDIRWRGEHAILIRTVDHPSKNINWATTNQTKNSK